MFKLINMKGEYCGVKNMKKSKWYKEVVTM